MEPLLRSIVRRGWGGEGPERGMKNRKTPKWGSLSGGWDCDQNIEKHEINTYIILEKKEKRKQRGQGEGEPKTVDHDIP